MPVPGVPPKLFVRQADFRPAGSFPSGRQLSVRQAAFRPAGCGCILFWHYMYHHCIIDVRWWLRLVQHQRWWNSMNLPLKIPNLPPKTPFFSGAFGANSFNPYRYKSRHIFILEIFYTGFLDIILAGIGNLYVFVHKMKPKFHRTEKSCDSS